MVCTLCGICNLSSNMERCGSAQGLYSRVSWLWRRLRYHRHSAGWWHSNHRQKQTRTSHRQRPHRRNSIRRLAHVAQAPGLAAHSVGQLTWLALGEDQAARSRRVEKLIALRVLQSPRRLRWGRSTAKFLTGPSSRPRVWQHYSSKTQKLGIL